jgi:hypothetical protein
MFLRFYCVFIEMSLSSSSSDCKSAERKMVVVRRIHRKSGWTRKRTAQGGGSGGYAGPAILTGQMRSMIRRYPHAAAAIVANIRRRMNTNRRTKTRGRGVTMLRRRRGRGLKRAGERGSGLKRAGGGSFRHGSGKVCCLSRAQRQIINAVV